MRLQIVIAEPYSSFKEKVKITKRYSKDKVQIMDNLVYIERWENRYEKVKKA